MMRLAPGCPINSPQDAHSAGGGSRDWRVGHRGRDQMFYEERDGFSWRRIEIDGEMLMGEAHHVIYFATPAQWLAKYPAWAQARRDEIIARIKSEFRPPAYEYFEGGGQMAATSPPVLPASAGTAKGGNSLWMILFLLGASFYMGWIVQKGLETGAVSFRGKYGVHVDSSRGEKPVAYWFTIAVLSSISLSAGGGALWLIGSSIRGK